MRRHRDARSRRVYTMSSLGGTTHHRDTTFTKIFVGGLPYHTSDQTLRSYFEPFGDITEAVVITDRQTGKSRGYGFVSVTPFVYIDPNKMETTINLR